MENYTHLMQFIVLLTSIQRLWRNRRDVFAAGNLSIYYPTVSSRTGRKRRKKLSFRGPDFFVVLGAIYKERRNSWVVENEDGKFPNLIVEILSKRTQAADRGPKKEIYRRIFKTPEYVLFDPEKMKLEGYRLVRGRYVAIRPDARGWLWSEQLGLFFGVHENKLRLFFPDGTLVPEPNEAADRAVQERDQIAHERDREKNRAERAEQAKARLIAQLQRLGIDPDTWQ
jgi:Uma2 family endonuclease